MFTVFTWVARALAGFFKSRATLVAENLCLRQQLLVHQRQHPRPRLGGQAEKGDEDGFEFALAVDLAGDVPDQAPQPGAQELEPPPGPLELMGMGVATHHDGSSLGDPQIPHLAKTSQRESTSLKAALESKSTNSGTRNRPMTNFP